MNDKKEPEEKKEFMDKVDKIQNAAQQQPPNDTEATPEEPQDWEKWAFEDDEPKISKEIAIEQVRLLLKRNRINIKKQTDPMIRNMITNVIDNVCEFVMNGQLEITNESGFIKIKQKLVHTSEKGEGFLIYGELNGRAHIATTGTNDNQLGMSVMINICEHVAAEAMINQLRSDDLDCIRELAKLFL